MSDGISKDQLKVVLVGIQLPKVEAQEFENSLSELSRLVTTLGHLVVGRVIQKRNSDRSASVLGEGKLLELARWTSGTGVITGFVQTKKTKAALKWDEENSEIESPDGEIAEDSGEIDEEVSEPETAISETADMVVVDSDLSPSQLRNLESATGVPVLDRTGVIIEIFGRHARTRAARLQVEIARLVYVAPRLRESAVGRDRGGGGVGGKGSGETSLELDKRKIRDRIKELKEELSSIGNEHSVRRARREREHTVALVGYTNAGKSSLMRALTGSEILVADQLFATLDTTVRPLHPPSIPKVLISDTVGFIKKLPHDLVASFKSTLDEALNATLLLFVVDASDPAFRSQLEVTQTVLAEVGAESIPRFLVFNKRDRLSENEIQDLKTEFSSAIFISTKIEQDLKMLRERILSHLERESVDEEIFVSYLAKGIIGEVRSRSRVLSESYEEKGTRMVIRASSDEIAYLKTLINSEESKQKEK